MDIITVSVCVVGISAILPSPVGLFTSCLGLIGLIYGVCETLMDNEERVQLVVSSTY